MSIWSHLFVGVVGTGIGSIVGSFFTYILGKRKDVWRINEKMEIEREVWRKMVLNEKDIIDDQVKDTSFENRRKMMDNVGVWSKRLTNLRTGDGKPANPDKNRLSKLDKYKQAVERLSYQEWSTSNVDLGDVFGGGGSSSGSDVEDADPTSREIFRERIDEYKTASEELETAFGDSGDD